MKIKKSSIFQQLTRNSLIIIIVILTVYTAAQYISFNSFSNQYEQEQIIKRYDEINVLSTKLSKEELYSYLNETINGREYVRIYSDEIEEYTIDSEVWGDIDTPSQLDTMVTRKLINGYDYSIISGPIQLGGQEYKIQIVQNQDLFDEFIEKCFPILLIITFLIVVLSIFGSVYVSRYFLKKLSLLTEAMYAIKDKGIRQRIEVSELKDEFDKINTVFNDMMDEVEKAFDEQKRFVADASHELKTPLTALGGHLNMLRRWGKNDKERLEKSLEVCVHEVERLQKIVRDMLLLSKTEGEKVDTNTLEHIEVSPIIRDVIEHYSILNSNITHQLSIEDYLQVKIREEDLRQLLVIFIDNAVKYNDKEVIKIDIKAYKCQEKMRLCIKDNGIGICEKELQKIRNRFYKVDKSRVNNQSFGLGLSIAENIIENYGGDMHISSQVGKYTEIALTI